MPSHGSWDVPFGFREGRKLPDPRAEGGSEPPELCSPRQECSGMSEGWAWGVPEYFRVGARKPRLRLIPVPETLRAPSLALLCPGWKRHKKTAASLFGSAPKTAAFWVLSTGNAMSPPKRREAREYRAVTAWEQNPGKALEVAVIARIFPGASGVAGTEMEPRDAPVFPCRECWRSVLPKRDPRGTAATGNAA